ncbi:MAG: AMP-binding protein [Alkalispirochaeta sp.]
MTEQETVPKRLRLRSKEHSERPFSWTKDTEGVFQKTTFSQMWDTVAYIGAGLHTLGVSRGDHVGIMSHNRAEWIFCDVAILGIGADDVPRGADSTAQEMAYFISHADC